MTLYCNLLWSSRIPDNLVLEYLQSFLQFLYLSRVLIKNLDDATLAPLSVLSNMQIRASIIEIPFFGHTSLKI